MNEFSSIVVGGLERVEEGEGARDDGGHKLGDQPDDHLSAGTSHKNHLVQPA
jgi:hypothetical protein